MLGHEDPQRQMFSYVDMDSRIPSDHPIRTIREVVDTALRDLGPSSDAMYAQQGRPSISPKEPK